MSLISLQSKVALSLISPARIQMIKLISRRTEEHRGLQRPNWKDDGILRVCYRHNRPPPVAVRQSDLSCLTKADIRAYSQQQLLWSAASCPSSPAVLTRSVSGSERTRWITVQQVGGSRLSLLLRFQAHKQVLTRSVSDHPEYHR